LVNDVFLQTFICSSQAFEESVSPALRSFVQNNYLERQMYMKEASEERKCGMKKYVFYISLSVFILYPWGNLDSSSLNLIYQLYALLDTNVIHIVQTKLLFFCTKEK
jgi:hypothetical protein